MDVAIITQLKEAGYSLHEINDTTMRDYFDIMDEYIKVNDPNPKKPARQASQSDIDKFTGWTGPK